ncbi:MAG: hypothetical protein IJZ85_06075 [Lachnospiraceae bacterium]|nr:hypothetical protein [Lachnospiraceae bacterium]
MYNEIGEKIKRLAQVSCIIGAVGSVILGIAMLDEGIDAGVGVILFCPLLFFISSWITYGFGQLVDDVHKLAQNKGGIHQENEDIKGKIDTLKKWKQEGLITETEYINKMEEM